MLNTCSESISVLLFGKIRSMILVWNSLTFQKNSIFWSVILSNIVIVGRQQCVWYSYITGSFTIYRLNFISIYYGGKFTEDIFCDALSTHYCDKYYLQRHAKTFKKKAVIRATMKYGYNIKVNLKILLCEHVDWTELGNDYSTVWTPQQAFGLLERWRIPTEAERVVKVWTDFRVLQ